MPARAPLSTLDTLLRCYVLETISIRNTTAGKGPPPLIIDSHCHLDAHGFDEDRDQVIERAREAGVDTMLTIGTGDGPPDLEPAIRLADRYPEVYATVGVHPHDARKADDDAFQRLAELLAHPKVLALGEIGLDYHYGNSPREIQRDVFVRQMDLARAAGKPIIIHARDAWDETIELLRAHWQQGSGIMHCFSGSDEEARQVLDLGFHISYAGDSHLQPFRRRPRDRRGPAARPSLGRDRRSLSDSRAAPQDPPQRAAFRGGNGALPG